MTRVFHRSTYRVPADFAFDYVADYRNVPDLVLGMERFIPRTEQIRGLGATFDAVVDIGPMKLDPVVDITHWIEHEEIGLHCRQKLVDATIDITMTPHQGAKVGVEIVGDYTVAGGFIGKIVEKALVIFVKLALIYVDRQFRELVETRYSAEK